MWLHNGGPGTAFGSFQLVRTWVVAAFYCSRPWFFTLTSQKQTYLIRSLAPTDTNLDNLPTLDAVYQSAHRGTHRRLTIGPPTPFSLKQKLHELRKPQ